METLGTSTQSNHEGRLNTHSAGMRGTLASILLAVLFGLLSNHATAQSLKDQHVGTWRLVK